MFFHLGSLLFGFLEKEAVREARERGKDTLPLFHVLEN